RAVTGDGPKRLSLSLMIALSPWAVALFFLVLSLSPASLWGRGFSPYLAALAGLGVAIGLSLACRVSSQPGGSIVLRSIASLAGGVGLLLFLGWLYGTFGS